MSEAITRASPKGPIVSGVSDKKDITAERYDITIPSKRIVIKISITSSPAGPKAKNATLPSVDVDSFGNFILLGLDDSISPVAATLL